MKNLEIKVGAEVQINGVVYPVLLDEVEMIEAAEKIQAEGQTIDKTPAGIRAYSERIIALIEAMLGPGAVAKIAGGKKIGIVNLLQIIILVTSDIRASYAEIIAEYTPRK